MCNKHDWGLVIVRGGLRELVEKIVLWVGRFSGKAHASPKTHGIPSGRRKFRQNAAELSLVLSQILGELYHL